MKKLQLIIFFLGFPFLMLHAEYIGSYTARIAEVDHYNSRGMRLYNAAAIIRQDRFNYHIRDISQMGDTWDPYFSKKYNREMLQRMLSHGTASRSALRKIIYGTPLINVEIFTDHINVKVLSSSGYSRIE